MGLVQLRGARAGIRSSSSSWHYQRHLRRRSRACAPSRPPAIAVSCAGRVAGVACGRRSESITRSTHGDRAPGTGLRNGDLSRAGRNRLRRPGELQRHQRPHRSVAHGSGTTSNGPRPDGPRPMAIAARDTVVADFTSVNHAAATGARPATFSTSCDSQPAHRCAHLTSGPGRGPSGGVTVSSAAAGPPASPTPLLHRSSTARSQRLGTISLTAPAANRLHRPVTITALTRPRPTGRQAHHHRQSLHHCSTPAPPAISPPARARHGRR